MDKSDIIITEDVVEVVLLVTGFRKDDLYDRIPEDIRLLRTGGMPEFHRGRRAPVYDAVLFEQDHREVRGGRQLQAVHPLQPVGGTDTGGTVSV